MEECKTVSLVIIAYNEEKYLPQLFDDIRRQTYPKQLIEIILVNSASTDGTEEIMKNFASSENEWSRVVLTYNAGKTQPCGWNAGLGIVAGDIILRVDAHASIPPDFIQKNADCINSGESVCGGYRPNITESDDKWTKTLLAVEQSMFGSSIAPYRRNIGNEYVKSVFHGAYRKEVFEKVGKFNENLVRTEDNEMHYRIRQAGYKICYNPDIVSWQYIRPKLRKMIKQKYLNGFWIGKTVKVCPKCLAVYHFIPFLFLCGILASVVLALLGIEYFLYAIALLYGSLTVVSAVTAAVKAKGNPFIILMPAMLLSLHLSYGAGTLVGLLK